MRAGRARVADGQAARGDRGFTLIESLVALVILAFAAVSLLAATEAHVVRIGGLETRALAQIAAENHLAEIELGLAPDEAEAELLGHAFRSAATRTPSDDPDLVRIDFTVTDAAGAVALRGFSAFVDGAAGVATDGAGDGLPDAFPEAVENGAADEGTRP